MWSIVKSLQRLIFRNGGSSIVLVYTASFFAPSYYSDMWESQHPGRRVMHQIRARNGRGGITPVGAPVIHDYSEWSYHKSFQQ